MNLEEITRILELMEKHDLTEFLIETDEMKLSLKRGSPQPAPASFAIPAYAPPQAAPSPAEPAPSASAETPETASSPGCITIESPLVGTFYRAPAPDKPPFVDVGDEVDENTVVCIVEAMKVMNEVKAECRGVITRVLVENGQPVEYGQPLFEVRPL